MHTGRIYASFIWWTLKIQFLNAQTTGRMGDEMGEQNMKIWILEGAGRSELQTLDGPARSPKTWIFFKDERYIDGFDLKG